MISSFVLFVIPYTRLSFMLAPGLCYHSWAENVLQVLWLDHEQHCLLRVKQGAYSHRLGHLHFVHQLGMCDDCEGRCSAYSLRPFCHSSVCSQLNCSFLFGTACDRVCTLQRPTIVHAFTGYVCSTCVRVGLGFKWAHCYAGRVYLIMCCILQGVTLAAWSTEHNCRSGKGKNISENEQKKL